MARILVTPRSVTKNGHPSLAKLEAAGHEIVFSTPGAQPSEEELVRLLPDCVGYLAGVEPVSARALEAAARLKVISRNGTGIDNIDLAAAKRLDIAVLRAAGANARGVVELTFGLMFSLARWIPYSDAGIKKGGWDRRKGVEIIGRTLGVIGCGVIGRDVARIATHFGMTVLGYDIAPDPAFHPSPAFRYAPLAEVLAQSDILTLHSPSCGKPLLDASALAKTKRGVLVINTARADLIDKAALGLMLDNGHVAGAAFDVFDAEPPKDDPLIRHDRVVATPHIGGFTDESVDRAVDGAVDNLLAFLGAA
ncbi:MAG TPA: phosphoglycerate dehydrogenase [Candidatus Hydrogenedentes bacterium]|nr:phosphoglycerate dehydrogenase [Candidatus Hydrogenedentota bacterium]